MCPPLVSDAPRILANGADALGPLPDDRDRNFVEVVIGAFNAATSIAGRKTAFEAAVRVYREHNPEASDDDAGRAVARIISHAT